MMLKSKALTSLSRRAAGLLCLTAVAAACLPAAQAQVAMDAAALAQVSNLLQEKEARTTTQAKLSSQLWYAVQFSRGQAMPGMDEVYASANKAMAADASGMVLVDITANVSDRLLAQIQRVGGQVRYASAAQQAIRASVPMNAFETLASLASVRFIGPAAQATTNVGSVTGQGIVSHKAKAVFASGINGTGVRVGVLSDSVGIAVAGDQLAALIASGDLPADAAALPGQDGGAASSEGTAMMEIIADMAPGAKIFFATAFAGQASFADNIRALRAPPYNCDIIVDDVSYFAEPAFQDGLIAKAVNDVVASGAMYFSSAANSGNLTSGTSGTWEGDYKAGAASAAPLPLGYTLHDFGTSQTSNALTGAASFIDLKWSDALGGSANDYDLFVLDSTGTTILCASTDIQSGTQDALEACYGTARPVGARIVVAKKANAAARALRIDTHRGRLTIGTAGSTYGHNAAAATQSTAAVFWNSAKTGTKPFVGGAANPTETFSSDGPRKIFFTPAGLPITPGNFLFASNGGTTLTKPELAAADGAFSKTPGFQPFFGTSAAAPYAAGVAALVKAARPDYTAAQVLTAMKVTALDIRAPGVDRDSGVGIVMAAEAVAYALSH
jgi:Subtilase family